MSTNVEKKPLRPEETSISHSLSVSGLHGFEKICRQKRQGRQWPSELRGSRASADLLYGLCYRQGDYL